MHKLLGSMSVTANSFTIFEYLRPVGVRVILFFISKDEKLYTIKISMYIFSILDRDAGATGA